MDERMNDIKMVSTKPVKFVIPHDLITNKIFSGELKKDLLNSDKNFVTYLASGRKKSINIYVGTKNKDKMPDFNYFDKAVYCAILSYYRSADSNTYIANKYVSAKMIARTIRGNFSNNSPVTEKMEQAVEESIKKMRDFEIMFDATGFIHSIREGHEPDDFPKFSGISKNGKLLYMKPVKVKTLAGKLVDAYRIWENDDYLDWNKENYPPLYMYSIVTRQISIEDINIINTSIQKTPDSVALQTLLLTEVYSRLSQKSSNFQKPIRVDTLYDKLGLKSKEYKKKELSEAKLKQDQSAAKNKMISLLNYWQDGYQLFSKYEVLDTDNRQKVSKFVIAPFKHKETYIERNARELDSKDLGIYHLVMSRVKSSNPDKKKMLELAKQIDDLYQCSEGSSKKKRKKES